jgi:hypothetical protein
MCCSKGKARCTPCHADDQRPLLDLLDTAEYRNNTRAYNSIFQMASSTANPTVLPFGIQQVRHVDVMRIRNAYIT